MKIPRFKHNTKKHNAIPTGDDVEDDEEELSSSQKHTVSMNRIAGIEDEDGPKVRDVLKWARKDFMGKPMPKPKVLEWLEMLKTAGNQSTDRIRIINLAIQEVEEE